MNTIFKSKIITFNKNKKLKIYNPGYLVISKNGIIKEITSKKICSKYPNYKFYDYSNYLIIPGLIDTHNHLAQYPMAGIGNDQLLPWLKKYIFPQEKELNKKEIAQKISKKFFRDLIKNGTTTVATYVTTNKNATDIAFREAEKSGIRAIIGKVMMDQNCPDFLKENTNKSLEQAEELIKKWHNKNAMLFYAITPRFAITCSFELLSKTAKLAKKYKTYIQTHLAENQNETKEVKKLFPKYKNYLDVYNKAGLLSEKTLMTHCIYLNNNDLKILKKTKTKIAHCPTSNRFLQSGIMDFYKYKNLELTIGLGTDVAGGYSLSIFNETKEAIENSKILSIYNKSSKPITIEDAFYSATLGGAKCLSLEKTIGSLEKNKSADFLIIDPSIVDPMGKQSKIHKPLQQLSQCIYRSSSNMIKEVYINGKKVK